MTPDRRPPSANKRPRAGALQLPPAPTPLRGTAAPPGTSSVAIPVSENKEYFIQRREATSAGGRGLIKISAAYHIHEAAGGGVGVGERADFLLFPFTGHTVYANWTGIN
ncbi:hypothetical protein EVAR_43436_1 [Eumeta japonica]|uniref:Uncharacterized protein n=1 Tax=Eumeta variegata TaxID=151549 RepID=A0A4C1WUJ8_EUMVA|nr:hypothetical protein EVAR_43436_1 [Eumeta japonica]